MQSNTHDTDTDACETAFTDALERERADRKRRIERLEQATTTIGALQSDLERLAGNGDTTAFRAQIGETPITADGSETVTELEVRATIDAPTEFHTQDLPAAYNWQHYALIYRDGQFEIKADLWLDSVVPEAMR